MDEVFKDPVQLSKGINIRELLTSATEFHIDADFKKQNPLDSVVLVDSEDDDSDIDEAFKNIEQSTEKVLLASPEYHTFDELAAKMTDCEPSGAVKMLVIEEGTGPLVSLDAEVTFHYAAYWEKATIPFDCSLTMNFGQPTKVRLGAGKILPGLEIGLTMVRGPAARFHLLLAPGATWGELGAPPRVKPERALFVIALYDVKDVQAGARFNDLPRAEQKKFEVTVKTVQSLHSVAKDLFTRRKYSKAIKNYQQSISILSISQPKDETETKEVIKLKISTYTNLIVCYYKLNKPKYIFNMLENLDRVIDIQTHCKALFYQGRAYEMQGNNEEALKYYKKALKLEPKNKEIGKTLASLDQSVKKSTANEKVMWQNAFQSAPIEKKEKVVYNVDEDFKKCVSDMCKDLAGRQEYAKFDLPTGLMKDEVEFIKSFISDFSGLTLQEDGEGRKKKLYIVKKS